jgi:tetratricopeptide (TPR) repeat protein/glycosyltransferase involved in cell wall biosynthesis
VIDKLPSRQKLLADARQCFIEGRLDQSQAACQRLLESNPGDAEALNLAGLIAYQRGAADDAVDLLEQAIAADGRQAQFHYNLGVVYQSNHRLEDAVEAYRQAAELEPRSAEVHNNLGFALYELGRLDEAIAALERALQLQPEHAQAHNNLGLALGASGKSDRALASFRRAIRFNPQLSEAHFNLGLALTSVGKNHAAVNSFRRTIEINPQHGEARRRLALLLSQLGDLGAIEALRELSQADPQDALLADELGNAFVRANRFEEALECYQAAVGIKPDSSGFLNNLGNVLRLLHRLDEAIEVLKQALTLAPDQTETRVNLGRAFSEQKRFDEAAQAFERALEIAPDHIGARCGLAQVLKEQGRREDAVRQYLESLRFRPDDAAAHLMLGVTYADLKRFSEAEEHFRSALTLDPANPVVHSNLANLLGRVGRADEAEIECRLAVALKPDFAEAHHNRGVALMTLARYDEATVERREALRLRPDYPDARLCEALDLLRQGNFEEGWPAYESRWGLQSLNRPTYSEPEWDGSPLAGRTIVLQAEQGLGDTLQFVRYAPLVERCGGRVVLACQKPLARLLGTARGIEQVVPDGGTLPKFDLYLPLLSAPRVLRTTLETIPGDIPYLFADEKLVEQWKAELAAIDGFKIGIAWQGNPNFLADLLRSIPLGHFERFARMEGVRLFSLQKGAGREQLAEIAGRFEVVDLVDRFDDFMDTAALVSNLDLVITLDSAVAHLAGALGARTWLALPLGGDWRWLEGREDSPWYPSMRLFRQRRLGDWNEVFQRMAVELEQELGLGDAASQAIVPSVPFASSHSAGPPGTKAGSRSQPDAGGALLRGSPEPLISVVIPCYNGSQYLAGCLESVLAQQADCEIIVVDDGSSDESLTLAAQWMREHDMSMVVVTRQNGGPAAARNTGLRMARGKYICFLDVDDQYRPGFFAAAVARLSADPSLVAVGCGVELFNLHRRVENWHADIVASSIPGNLFLRRDVVQQIGGFPSHPAFRGKVAGEDVAFRQQLFRLGNVGVLEESFYKYRVQAGSHFDLFVDRAFLEDGKVKFKWLTPEEKDGSWRRAAAQYAESVHRQNSGRLVYEPPAQQVNLSCCINATGDGVVGLNVLKALRNRGASVACWPQDPLEPPPEDAELIRSAVERQAIQRDTAASLLIYHQFSLQEHLGKPRIGFPIFELDRFTDDEVENMRAQDLLLVPSQWARQVVDSNGVFNGRDALRVVPLGVDRSIFHHAPMTKEDGATIFLAIGNWERRKGHDFLLEAFNSAFARDDAVELWIVACNPVVGIMPKYAAAAKEVENTCHACPLAENIKLLPWQSSPREVADLMRKADCGVFLSRAEGWNLPALEMLSCGKHIIVTNYSAHTEYCNASNARLVEIDALEDAYDNVGLHGQGRWAALGPRQLEAAVEHMRQVHAARQQGCLAINDAGIESARSFSWDACATRILDAIKSL